MRDRTRTVVVGVLAGGLGSLGASGCDAIQAALDFADPEPECCYNPPPPRPDPTPPPAEPQKFEVNDQGELPATPLKGDPPRHEAGGTFVWDGARSLNATHPEHGTIYRNVGACEVHLPWPEDANPYPGMVPPMAVVSCPAPMAEFLWSQCYTGTIYTDAAGETCVCSLMGNPPPPNRFVHCPPEAKPPEADDEPVP